MNPQAFRARDNLRSRVRMGVAVIVAFVLGLTGLVVAPALAAPPTTGIFADDLRPTLSADFDREAVELGVRFSPDEAGTRLLSIQEVMGNLKQYADPRFKPEGSQSRG